MMSLYNRLTLWYMIEVIRRTQSADCTRIGFVVSHGLVLGRLLAPLVKVAKPHSAESTMSPI